MSYYEVTEAAVTVLKTNNTYERNIAARLVAIVAVEKQWEYVLNILIVCCL
jgi:hypothetical protein